APRLAAFFSLVQRLHADARLLAYHDISDGGLFTTLVEMAFASRCHLDVALPVAADAALAALFAEELGAVVQVRTADVDDVLAQARDAGAAATAIRTVSRGERVVMRCRDRTVLD